MALVVPEQAVLGFAKLADLPGEVFDDLVQRLSRTPIAIDQIGHIRQAIPEQVANSQDRERIAYAISGIHHIYARTPSEPQELAEECTRTALVQGHLKDGEKATALTQYVLRLLSVPELSLGHKASCLMVEHEKVFSSARIMSDVRPVFDEKNFDANKFPAVLINHNLKVEYWESGDLKEFYIALDSEDLRTLSDVVTRAERKSGIIRRLVTGSLTDNVLETSREEEGEI